MISKKTSDLGFMHFWLKMLLLTLFFYYVHFFKQNLQLQPIIFALPFEVVQK